MLPSFIQELQSKLLLPLPGIDAQSKMAPLGRLIYEYPDFEAFNPKKGSVLILLYPHGNGFKVVFIKRTEYKGVHSGQVSFPGGRFEPSDFTLDVTALRETKEEIGVDVEKVLILGNLTQLYISPSNFLVSPFIGFIDENPNFVPDKREVEAIIEADLSDLGHAFRDVQEKQIRTSGDIVITAPYLDVSGHHIWGATAMISSEFMEVVNSIDKEAV